MDISIILCQFALIRDNDQISYITLVSLKPRNLHKSDLSILRLNDAAEGTPIFNLDPWAGFDDNIFSSRFIDNDSDDFIVFYDTDSLLIQLDDCSSSSWIKCGSSFYFGIDEKNYCHSVFVHNINEADMAKFMSCVTS